jgi:hypothetical protein
MDLEIVSPHFQSCAFIQNTYTEQRGHDGQADDKVKSGCTPEQDVGYHKHLLPVFDIRGEVVYTNSGG